jgi:hypothetical protein
VGELGANTGTLVYPYGFLFWSAEGTSSGLEVGLFVSTYWGLLGEAKDVRVSPLHTTMNADICTHQYFANCPTREWGRRVNIGWEVKGNAGCSYLHWWLNYLWVKLTSKGGIQVSCAFICEISIILYPLYHLDVWHQVGWSDISLWCVLLEEGRRRWE